MSNRNQKPPKAIDIVMYWYNKKIIEHRGKSLCLIIDIGEPTCQGCNTWHPDWDIGEFKNDYKYDTELINHRWEMSPLEKAHIIPYRWDGLNIPSNFLLLCRSCHLDFDRDFHYTNERYDISTVYDWLLERPKKVSDIKMELFHNFIKEHNLNIESMRKAYMFEIKDILKIFNNDQADNLNMKLKKIFTEYNIGAKNLKEQFLISLHIAKAILEIATESQMESFA